MAPAERDGWLMMADLEADDLLRRLLQAWRRARPGDGADFPWAHEDSLRSALARVAEEMTGGVALGVQVGEEPAVLVVTEDEARTVGVGTEGVETTYLGALAGGTLTVTEEQVDIVRVRATVRYRHRRLPGDLVHVAERESEFTDQERVRRLFQRWSTDQAG